MVRLFKTIGPGAHFLVGAAFFCALSGAAPVRAQVGTARKASPRAKNARPQSAASASLPAANALGFTLGADDVISITVLRHPEYSKDALTIPASGQIDLPDAGTIRVAGLSPTQAARAIAHALSGTLVAPEVAVELQRSRPRRVYVLGAVAKTSVYEMTRGWRISDALAAAGGVPGRVDETAGTLVHLGMAPIPVNLQEVLDNPSSPRNLLLRENDTLSLRALEPKQITVSGDVAKAGAFPLRNAKRLLDALTLAGGTKEPTARTHATLTRNGRAIVLDLEGAEIQNTPQTNIALQDGDFILVTSVPPLQITVSGPTTFVRNPGNFSLAPDSGVAQAVAQAGLTVLPEQVVATLLRGHQTFPIDLRRAAIDPAFNRPLQNGDVVSISEPDVIRVSVAGAVAHPGPLRISPRSTLLQALAGAGGLSIRPDEARIAILRAPSVREANPLLPIALETTGEKASGAISVDAVALFKNDPVQNVVLQDGDLVSVTQIKLPTVIVSGQVVKTGPYQVADGEGIAALLARAGGTTPEAALSRVVLQRGTTTRVVDISNEVRTGMKSGVSLQDGDSVIVPENMARVVVMNAVQRPGPYVIPEDRVLTVYDALALAGGPRDRASVKNVVLLRPHGGGENNVEKRIIALDKIAAGDLSQNVPLRAGDIVYVPEARASSGPSLIASIGQIVGTLTGLRYLTGR